jgi:hypothetical protein
MPSVILCRHGLPITSQPGGVVLFEGGFREFFWPAIQSTSEKPLTPYDIHKRKFRRGMLLFVGAWATGIFAGTLGVLFGSWNDY